MKRHNKPMKLTVAFGARSLSARRWAACRAMNTRNLVRSFTGVDRDAALAEEA